MRLAKVYGPAGFVLILLFLLQLSAHSETRKRDVLRAFQWFDTLGYPSIAKLPFVRVFEGNPYTRDGGPLEAQYQYGFLIKEQGRAFTIFFPDLTLRTFQRTTVGTATLKRIGFERLNLIAWTEHWLSIGRRSSQLRPDRWDGFAGELEPQTQMFLLARACAARGHTGLALHVWRIAEGEGGGSMSGEETWSFRQRLANRMARVCVWRATLQFGQPTISRETLLAVFSQIGRRFPNVGPELNVKPTVLLLRRMVQEDHQHAASRRGMTAPVTGQQHIAELIYQLRDQNGAQYMQPGSCDIFADPRGEKSPADQLVKMDAAAVPQLIDSLADRRFTRSVGYWRNFTFSHHVLRVGDAALAIIERIASRSFYTRTYTNAEMSKDGRTGRVRAEVLKWWKSVQSKGEKSVLMDAVSRGNDNASSQAPRLVERYPDAALPAIEEGIRRAANEQVRCSLVQSARNLKGDAVTVLLREQMERGNGISVRVTAAFGVRERGGRDAVPRMIDEWRRYDGIGSGFVFMDPLVSFLTSSGSPPAMEAVGKDLIKRPILARLNVVTSLSGGSYRGVTTRGTPERQSAADPKDQALVEKQVEEILASELMDTEEEEGLSMGGEVSFRDPRLCELSAYGLSVLWPQRYQFKNGGSLFERDYQRIRLYNIWLQENGKPALALPERPRITPVPADVIAAALNHVLTVPSAPGREGALRAIEQMGLPALPAVIQTLHTVEPKSPFRPGLEMLAARLSCIVRKTEAGRNMAELPGTITAELDNLRARTLTATDLVHLLRHAANQLHGKWTGIVLRANRDTDGSGFEITLDALPGTLEPPSSSTSWSYSMRVQAGEADVYGTSGGGGYDKEPGHGPSDGIDLQELTDAIKKSLASAPLKSVSISVRLVRKQ